jgi:hypothetical protein
MKGIVFTLLCCATAAFAKDGVKVRTAWSRTFPNSGLSITSDHLGHVLAVGNETNFGIAILLDTRGHEVAKTSVPLRDSALIAAADHSGRIFIAAADIPISGVQCAAFAPLLSDLLWMERRSLTNLFLHGPEYAHIAALTPDENGAAYGFGDWHRAFFLSQFRGDNGGFHTLWMDGLRDGRIEYGATSVRSPNGDIFGVGTTFTLPKYPWITVLKYSPATGELSAYDRVTLFDGYISRAADAACDPAGNLIIVGEYSADALSLFVSGRRCLTTKMDSQFNVVWQRIYGPLNRNHKAHAVAVDASGAIIMTGTAGTVKYSSAGDVIWEAPETGTAVRLNAHGQILLSRPVTLVDGIFGIYESEITKLNTDGSRRWQAHVLEGPQENWAAGLIAGDDGEDYFATRKGDNTIIMKFVEHGQSNEEPAR